MFPTIKKMKRRLAPPLSNQALKSRSTRPPSLGGHTNTIISIQEMERRRRRQASRPMLADR